MITKNVPTAKGKSRKYIFISSSEIVKELPKYLETPFPIKNITIHWNAGAYNNIEPNYHIQVVDDGIWVSSVIATEIHSHCWHRNSGNIGISFVGMAFATKDNWGKYPITSNMMEIMGNSLSVLKEYYQLGWSKINDHRYYAKLDGYSKIDCMFKWIEEDGSSKNSITRTVKNKAIWYHSKNKKQIMKRNLQNELLKNKDK